MNEWKPISIIPPKRMILFLHRLSLFFILALFHTSYLYGVVDPYKWDRLPLESEINSAKQMLINQLSGDISVNGKIIDKKTIRLSPIVKYHNKKSAGKVEPQIISRLLIFVERQGIMGQFLEEYQLIQSRQNREFVFMKLVNGTASNNLDEQYNKFIDYIINYADNDSGMALGFAPDISGSSSNEDSTISTSISKSESEDDGLWTVVIGAFIGAILAGILRRRKRKKENRSKETKKAKPKDKKKNKVEYILQISRDTIALPMKKTRSFTIHVWKVTNEKKFKINANIEILNQEKALHISPQHGIGTLKGRLTLKEIPQESQFTITVVANAEGHIKQKDILITTQGQQQILVKTFPDNMKSLRPNTHQAIACYAKVVDENGKDLPELTKSILFKPLSKWIDLSNPIMDDGWIAINMETSDPDAIAAVSHPPKSVILSITMEKVEKNKPILRNDLEVQLLDCKLNTNLDSVSFPAIEKQSEVILKAYIEDCDESKQWNFKAGYQTYGNKPDSKALTTIDIEKVSDLQVNIILKGPILLPKENEQFLRKKLLIEAQQKKEEPLQREIYVTVSKEGLFIEEGLDKGGELSCVANGDMKKRLEFGLFRYDQELNEVVVDKNGLKNIEFELLSQENKEKNIDSVLKPKFDFDTLVKNIPNARYSVSSSNEIPAYGETINLNYQATVPALSNTENADNFQVNFVLAVKTLDTGKRKPTWKEAYDDCRYIIDTYVPEGNPRNKLGALLEKRKDFLDAEGLVELRKQMWKIAYNLILADGAKGYESVDAWSSAIVETLEWTKWAGDICFNILIVVYASKLGRVGSVGAGMLKGYIVEALVFYINDQGSASDFMDKQYSQLIPMLMNMGEGRLISVDNIKPFVKNNKVLAWSIFISIEFAWNLYNTKSMIEAAKATLRNIRDEALIRHVSKYIKNNPVKTGLKMATKPPKYKSVEVRRALKKLENSMKKNRIGGKFLNKDEVLEIMKNPELVRTIKEHGSDTLKKAFDGPRKKIYQEHDRALKNEIAKQEGIDPKDLDVDDFRTPGAKVELNTDRDYRLLRRYITPNGKEIWLEVPRKKWLNKSYEKLAKLTGKPVNITTRQWAEQLQQKGTDKYDDEACADYSDHAIDSKGNKIRVNPNIIDVKNAKSILIDPEGMGRMYKQKVINAGETPEAFAQAKKAVHTIEKVRQSYKKQGYKLLDIDSNLKKAMKVIEDSKVTVDASSRRVTKTYNEFAKDELNKLGYKNINDVMDHVSNEFSALENLKTPNIGKKIFSKLFK